MGGKTIFWASLAGIVGMQRIFISGIGVVSCLGNDRKTFWKNITAGQCGIDRLVLHDTKDLDVNIGGEVKDLNEARININDLVSTRKMDRASQFCRARGSRSPRRRRLPTKELGENVAVIIGADSPT